MFAIITQLTLYQFCVPAPFQETLNNSWLLNQIKPGFKLALVQEHRLLKNLLFLPFILLSHFRLVAQAPVNCTFKPPAVTLQFGNGEVADLNTAALSNYRPVPHSCPSDGHYTYTSYTSDCFRGDWHTLDEDHTPGDAGGNMMIVNASYRVGTFLRTSVSGLKGGTMYEFGVWMMNVCKPTEKCPFPLLPDITIELRTLSGQTVSVISTGELVRRETPHWTQYRAMFTTPPSETSLTLTMIDNSPGGCGNDFALDDITFRECIKIPPVVKTTPRTTKPPAIAKAVPKKETPPTVALKQPPVVSKPVPKKETPPPTVAVKKPPVISKPVPKKEVPEPETRQPQSSTIARAPIDTPARSTPVIKQTPRPFPAAPAVITARANPLVTKIESDPGNIKIDVYDNGIVDGDTISIYHNNVLVVSHVRISEKPTTIYIVIDPAHPHHELIMVAHNLGSIPPNTSLMIVTTPTKRHEVFISSNEQKNAKVVLDLRE